MLGLGKELSPFKKTALVAPKTDTVGLIPEQKQTVLTFSR